jgi:hypothetical protein
MTVDQKGQDLVIDCLFTGSNTTPVQIVYQGPLTTMLFGMKDRVNAYVK